MNLTTNPSYPSAFLRPSINVMNKLIFTTVLFKQKELADVRWDGPGSIHITFAFIFGSTTHLMDETFYSVIAALSHLLHLQIA